MSKYHTFENPTQLSKSQLWLIATSAMLAELNKEYHDTLLPHHIYSTPLLLKDSKQCLLRDWEIKNLADLSDTFNYLHNEKTFAAVQDNWELLSNEELKQNKHAGIDMEFSNLLSMVDDYQFDLAKSDYGWHYGRCAWLIRHSFYNDFITESEAWSLLEENGKRIKDSFDSWESFGLSYIIGAQYWKSKEYTEVVMMEFKNNINYLLSNKNSPWLNVDWNDFE
ncbi:DUF1266 domain-containing protein [uncultured Cytophaga sp.]|uniref:DUF1266 domain-containing protein n=1 Tax=uncultured Cytophaga sp. TaxID=160238 RepID=UPI0026274A9F|nr:DUF1266 domain-containing protein [uncultured Cytophaga sp.]